MNKEKLKEEQGIFKEIWGVKPTEKELKSLDLLARKMREKGII